MGKICLFPASEKHQHWSEHSAWEGVVVKEEQTKLAFDFVAFELVVAAAAVCL